MPKVLLGVSASISAYKAADIISQLKKQQIDVEVIMTKNSTQIIPPLTLQVLSKETVHTDVMYEHKPSDINHIDMVKRADLFLVAPATANIIGKMANGIADDMLSTTALAVHDIPKLVAPAMNTYMYTNPAMKRNLTQLEEDGYTIIEPKESLLACGDYGKGALADVEVIVDIIKKQLIKK
ncbi:MULTISPECIES: phosphopantothenoylcysteine decarboxylase [unclassified Vagococcus]|uniref:phosphopantothenoylcysteine decarboxylase n=1 Tax=unclassified Vagococcus TaxID=2648499 RepID=UPI001F50EEDD|nr:MULTISPECIES: phosphopantothenoylcysteine decarboxylase [unclassified Vagococcus]MCI0130871.1 phosphopantothenoylcysteine decarboxylase [Vagococcus sp. CY53-2]UNM89253.1 phosphopantothenoylcysteine decarboxylase [Vagococcus sp. CY52-2]